MDQRLAELYLRLLGGFQRLAEVLPKVMEEPRAYPREALLFALLFALALVFAILIGFALYDAIAGAIEARRLGLRPKRRRRFGRAAIMVVVATILLVAAAVSPAFVPTGKACGTCHSVAPSVESWQRDAHSGVACYGCHAEPGATGAIAASVQGVGNVFASDEELPGITRVGSAGCLRCHEEIHAGVVGRGVSMSHEEVIAAGLACVECHSVVGHAAEEGERVAPASRIERRTMSLCITCHDGQIAPSDCDICHATKPYDLASAPAAGGSTGIPIACKGCHQAATDQRCIACHGLELPHDGVFFRRHAGLSYNDPALCARCHEQASSREGCGCHGDTEQHGTMSAWFPLHGPQAANTGPGGCNCHTPYEVFCGRCHDTTPF